MINDQYRSSHGSQRFLHNIVRYSGCGVFSPQVSHVIVHRPSRELVGLILGSRVSPQSGHITQLCVHPASPPPRPGAHDAFRGRFCFMQQGATEMSLTVTESNQHAIELYLSEGYTRAHTFDAAVWQRPRIA